MIVRAVKRASEKKRVVKRDIDIIILLWLWRVNPASVKIDCSWANRYREFTKGDSKGGVFTEICGIRRLIFLIFS